MSILLDAGCCCDEMNGPCDDSGCDLCPANRVLDWGLTLNYPPPDNSCESICTDLAVLGPPLPGVGDGCNAGRNYDAITNVCVPSCGGGVALVSHFCFDLDPEVGHDWRVTMLYRAITGCNVSLIGGVDPCGLGSFVFDADNCNDPFPIVPSNAFAGVS